MEEILILILLIQDKPPHVVHSTEYNDELSKEILDLGFSLTYTLIEIFTKLDNDNEENIPLKYKIKLIDERVDINEAYKDEIYDDLISKAKTIFIKYKTQFNKNNQKLLLNAHFQKAI